MQEVVNYCVKLRKKFYVKKLRESLCSVCEFLVDWASTTGRLLGSATCLPHKVGGIPLSALSKGTASKLANMLSITLSFMLSAKQGSSKYHF